VFMKPASAVEQDLRAEEARAAAEAAKSSNEAKAGSDND